MAGQRNVPGLGLTAFWNLGSDGWKSGMDQNLLVLSVLTNASVESRSAPIPPALSLNNGQRFIAPPGHPNQNAILARDNGAFAVLPPQKGYQVFVEDENLYVGWNGAAWVEIAGLIGLPDAPFRFVQNAPATVWTIPHGFGREPHVSIYDPAGEKIEAFVVATSSLVTITFSPAFAGAAILS